MGCWKLGFTTPQTVIPTIAEEIRAFYARCGPKHGLA